MRKKILSFLLSALMLALPVTGTLTVQAAEEAKEVEQAAERDEIPTEERDIYINSRALGTGKTTYTNKNGYYTITVTKGTARAVYRVSSTLSDLEMVTKAANITYTVSRSSGSTGAGLIPTVTSLKPKADTFVGGPENWAVNERLYIFRMEVTLPEPAKGNHWFFADGTNGAWVEDKGMVLCSNVVQIGTAYLGHTTPAENPHGNLEVTQMPNTYAIAYDGNGGTGSISGDSVEYGAAHTVNGTKFFARKGHTMAGYYIRRKSDGKIWGGSTNGWVIEKAANQSKYKLYQPGEEVTIGNRLVADDIALLTDTFTFVASWEKNTYTIAYQKNGGSGTIPGATVTYGEEYTISSSSFTRSGYTFKGYYVKRSDGKVWCGTSDKWMKENDANASRYKIYNKGSTITVGSTLIDTSTLKTDTFALTALWEANTYRVTYLANGGISVSKSIADVKYGQPVDLGVTAVPADNYHTFVGWSTTADGTTALSTQKMQNGDITLYAIYSIPTSGVRGAYLKVWDSSWSRGADDARAKIYPLSKTASTIRSSTYRLSKDVSVDFAGTAQQNLCGALYGYDNAGNIKVLRMYQAAAAPLREQYLQTVNYWLYDRSVEAYRLDLASCGAYKYAGEVFQAAARTFEGYISETRNAEGLKSYTVTGEKTTDLYYIPAAYTLYFHANGGDYSSGIDDGFAKDTQNLCHKSIYYKDTYGEMPVPNRKGYTFAGWFTEASGGQEKRSNDIYDTCASRVLYAHWTVNTCHVTYDHWTNGGTGAEQVTVPVTYGSEADLSVKAIKNGWTHIGWNTDPEAQTGLTSYVVEEDEVLLYAIYQKPIKVTYIDQSESGRVSREDIVTIYNREQEGTVIIPQQTYWKGWEAVGWALGTDGDSPADTWEGAKFSVTDHITLYGTYIQSVTVRYNPNGSGQEFPEESKTRYYNGSGTYKNPEFVLADAPTMTQQSFVGWMDEENIRYHPREKVMVEKDTLYRAEWDRYPEIQACDRYFTLEQAQGGQITREALLERAIGWDREDGSLQKITMEGGELGQKPGLSVKDYQVQDFLQFTSDGSVSVTYRALDSFGNETLKQIMVHIADTSIKEDTGKRYIRFINPDFYGVDIGENAPEQGGLEEHSVWKENPVYQALITHAMENKKENQSFARVGLFGKIYQIPRPGTGNWEHKKETWTFSREKVQELTQFISDHGYGNYRREDGIAKFYLQFGACRN